MVISMQIIELNIIINTEKNHFNTPTLKETELIIINNKEV